MKVSTRLFAFVAAAILTSTAMGQEISYLSESADTGSRPAALRALTDEFGAANPGVSWVFTPTNPSNVVQQVQILAASNALPLFFEMPDQVTAGALFDTGRLVDYLPLFERLGLSQYLDEVSVARLQVAQERGTDVLYSLPLSSPIEGLVYNRALFEANDLEPPRTWSDLVAVCDAFLEAGIQPLSIGGGDAWPILRFVGMYGIRKLGDDVLERVRAGEVSLTDPGFVEGATALQDLINRGCMGRDVSSQTFLTAIDMFTAGESAMTWGISSVAGLFGRPENTVPVTDMGVINFPLVEGGAGGDDTWLITVGNPLYMSVSAYEADAERVDRYLQYVIPRYGARSMEFGNIPGLVIEGDGSSPSPEIAMFVERLNNAKVGVFHFQQYFSSRGFVTAEQSASLLATSQITPEQFLQGLQDANQQ